MMELGGKDLSRQAAILCNIDKKLTEALGRQRKCSFHEIDPEVSPIQSTAFVETKTLNVTSSA